MKGFKSVLSINKIDVEAHLIIKFSKRNFGGILRPKSGKRPLVTGLIHRPTSNEQFASVLSLLEFAA